MKRITEIQPSCPTERRVMQPTPLCPYCDKPAELVGGSVIYPDRTDLHWKRFWRCAPCDAYVGCHGRGTTPLGRLANFEVRRARVRAHAAFDPLWSKGRMPRWKAYQWLAGKLKLPVERTHIGEFDVETCNRVVALCTPPMFEAL